MCKNMSSDLPGSTRLPSAIRGAQNEILVKPKAPANACSLKYVWHFSDRFL